MSTIVWGLVIGISLMSLAALWLRWTDRTDDGLTAEEDAELEEWVYSLRYHLAATRGRDLQ